VAIGREAIIAGYTVLFTPATTLVAQLAKAHADGRLEERLTHYAKPKLLIVDELGYLPFEPDAAHLFFQLVSRRYERGAMLVTSNRAVGEWGSVLGDPVVATAILDRLLHHSHVLTIRGESYTGYARSGGADCCKKPRQQCKPPPHDGHPDQPERGVVLAAVKHASRRLRRWPAAMLDRSCARHLSGTRPGRRNGCARTSWRVPTGESPVRVRGSARPAVSVARQSATAGVKRTQRVHGVQD
jgi:hypothetical protein